MIDELRAAIDAKVAALRDRSAVPLRRIRVEFSKRIRGAEPREVIALAFALLPEHRFIAYELIAKHRGTTALLDARTLERLAGTLASWVDVDMFGIYLSGPAWRDGAISDAVIARWAKSKDRWWRRAALVSTIRTADTKRTLTIARMLAGDRDDMVVKAMSWALRELSKHDKPAVARFIEEEHGDVLPRCTRRGGLRPPEPSAPAKRGIPLAARVMREVRSKLTTGRKS